MAVSQRHRRLELGRGGHGRLSERRARARGTVEAPRVAARQGARARERRRYLAWPPDGMVDGESLAVALVSRRVCRAPDGLRTCGN